jgi:hypothetical protein
MVIHAAILVIFIIVALAIFCLLTFTIYELGTRFKQTPRRGGNVTERADNTATLPVKDNHVEIVVTQNLDIDIEEQDVPMPKAPPERCKKAKIVLRDDDDGGDDKMEMVTTRIMS